MDQQELKHLAYTGECVPTKWMVKRILASMYQSSKISTLVCRPRLVNLTIAASSSRCVECSLMVSQLAPRSQMAAATALERLQTSKWE